jgi:hypothetical protein
VPCASCGRHVRRAEGACPFCKTRRIAAIVSAGVVSAAMGACAPAYGGPAPGRPVVEARDAGGTSDDASAAPVTSTSPPTPTAPEAPTAVPAYGIAPPPQSPRSQ